MLKLPTPCLALLAMSCAGVAQDVRFIPLVEAIQSSPDQSYAFVRCAAFVMAHIEREGEDRFAPDALEDAKMSFAQFAQVADSIRHGRNTPGSIQIADDVYRDIRAIKGIYLDRFDVSYAKTGIAYDELWMSDSGTCRAIEKSP